VDYWNYLGWKDAWSDAEYSERQRGYAQLWHAENIYTPELVLNGREWHHWFSGHSGPPADGEIVGVLRLVSQDQKLWRVSFYPAQNAGARYEIHAATLAGGIVSNVRAGENSGRRLEHDFAVVNLLQIGLTTSNGVAQGRFILNPATATTGTSRSLVAWVTRVDELQPIQAVGGWLTVPPETRPRKD
jgi:hypothetical protein